ncbi:hypothetical protein, partial [Siminovitchia terrae]|uniref:hypothetical protein n=1 Tax=Siminovitchia terrae TaxID=1914933 RepID=UPI0028A93DFF
YRAELDKIWTQIRQGAFDVLFPNQKPGKMKNPLCISVCLYPSSFSCHFVFFKNCGCTSR